MIRVRATIAAALLAGVALALAAVILTASARRAFDSEVEEAAFAEADAIVATLGDGGAVDGMPTPPEDRLFQVVDGRGRVVASSENVRGRAPVADLAPGESEHGRMPVDDGQFMVVARAAPDGATVLVAHSLDAAGDSSDAVGRLVGVGIVPLMLLVGAMTWIVVGRVLAPVDAMRVEAEAITVTDLGRRVTVRNGRDELAALGRTLNAMLDRLEAGVRRQRQFVSDASHELRSPTASIRQHAEVALAHPDRTDVRRLAGTVLAEEARLEGLVDDLLLLARADESGGVSATAARREIDLDDVVFEEIARVRQVTSVTVDMSAVSAASVVADRTALARVVANLLANATSFARSTVVVSLTARDDGDVQLAVDDDGPGVPIGDRVRIFDRFVRLDSARSRRAGGSGLGLAIVTEVVRSHGGSIEVTDSAQGGARFVVTLPGSAAVQRRRAKVHQ